MSLTRPRRRAPQRVAALWVAVLIASSCSVGALASVGAKQSIKLGGTWSGSYAGAATGTFTLHWKETRSKLIGTIKLSNPNGTYNITGSVSGTGISFGAVGVGAVYSGTVAASGLSMSGKWTSGPATGTWKARKVLTPTKTKVKKS